jgi:hypothetical protein
MTADEPLPEPLKETRKVLAITDKQKIMKLSK